MIEKILKVEIEKDVWFDCVSGTEKLCEMKGDRANERVPSSCVGDVGSTERISYIAPKIENQCIFENVAFFN